MSGRRAIVAAGLVIGIVILVLAWTSRRADEPAARTPQATSSQPQEVAPAARAPEMPTPPVAAGLGEGSDGEEQPQPVPLPPGANPPPLDGKRSEPAPPQKAFSPADVIAKREADLKLIDDTKTRLEADLAAAKTGSDATAVHDLEIRIARLGDLRKKRSAELDKLRAGGSATP